MDSMTKQRREGEANRPTRAKTGQRKLIKPSWTEFVRLADQAVVAIAGADMINRAERRACGCSRRSRRLDTKWPGTDERQLLRQTKPRKVSEVPRRKWVFSSRTGENPPYGMNRGGGGNFGMTRGLFATMLERADTKEAIGLNRSRLRSTRPCSRALSRFRAFDGSGNSVSKCGFASLLSRNTTVPRSNSCRLLPSLNRCRGLAFIAC